MKWGRLAIGGALVAAAGIVGSFRLGVFEVARLNTRVRELEAEKTKLADFARRLVTCPPQLVGTARKRFERTEKILAVLGPDATLRRGYTMTMDATGNLVRSVTQVKRGDTIHTRITDGAIDSEVSKRRS